MSDLLEQVTSGANLWRMLNRGHSSQVSQYQYQAAGSKSFNSIQVSSASGMIPNDIYEDEAVVSVKKVCDTPNCSPKP